MMDKLTRHLTVAFCGLFLAIIGVIGAVLYSVAPDSEAYSFVVFFVSIYMGAFSCLLVVVWQAAERDK